MNTLEIKLSKENAEKRAKRVVEIVEISIVQQKSFLSESTKAELLENITNHFMQFNFALEE
jgi:hypothetical protein